MTSVLPTASAPARASAGDRPALAPLVALALGYFLVMLDVTAVNVALPDLRGSLGAGHSALQWIVDGYSTVFAGLLLVGGNLADRVGSRRVFLAGLGVFTAASLVCAGAGGTGVLVAGRLAQGAGAALLVPASLALLQSSYPGRAARARAVAVWGAVASVAFGAGPVVGGLLVTGLGWRSVFWLNLPVAALAVVLTLRYVSRGARPAAVRGADPLGQVLGVVGLVALACGLNEAGTRGWTSPLVLGGFAIGLTALVAFVAVERAVEADKARSPLFPPSLLRARAFSATAAVGLLMSLGYYGMLFLSTLYFQQERGFSALTTGLALLPSVCMGLVAAPLFSRVAARTGPYVPMVYGLVLGGTGFLGWLLAGPATPYPFLLFALVATGLGQTTTALAATAAIIDAAPAGGTGVATAAFNVSRQIGSAVGVALFGTFAAGGGFVTGLHASAVVAAVAFGAGAVLAVSARRAARERGAEED
ncbi:MFS transporter [Streptomyces spiroverticillatus]|uniref:MFS transporter n=1 Tax=Streptomyces finlayi TaxID=67296 RepID=A0A918X005_9ACTN|nr:MFS transporter [Streptomyces finlayi]GHA17836.1 MFS transporter [Streptomyces spiroverticillatus]GHC99590.1 MFS transporter [Streptomyces finlayi]